MFFLSKFSQQLAPLGDQSQASYINTKKSEKCRPPIKTQKRPAESQEALCRNILCVISILLNGNFDFNHFLFFQVKSNLSTPRQNLMVADRVRPAKIT